MRSEGAHRRARPPRGQSHQLAHARSACWILFCSTGGEDNVSISWFPAERKRRASMSKRILVLLLLFFSIAAYVAPSHPVPIETWDISADGEIASVSGRVKQPIW